MATFKVCTVVGVWGKKLGKEAIEVELTEWEMLSILKCLHHWNKSLYTKIKVGLIKEALSDGYEITFVLPDEAKAKGGRQHA